MSVLRGKGGAGVKERGERGIGEAAREGERGGEGVSARMRRDVQRRRVLRITSHQRIASAITEGALCVSECVCSLNHFLLFSSAPVFTGTVPTPFNIQTTCHCSRSWFPSSFPSLRLSYIFCHPSVYLSSLHIFFSPFSPLLLTTTSYLFSFNLFPTFL